MEKSLVLVKTKNAIIETEVELATTTEEIRSGLSGRHFLLHHEGMAFLFPAPTKTNFWMLNTYLPLSIAFFNEEGTIIDIQDMQPNTIEGHSAPTEFKGALEMKQGWFKEYGVEVGDTITLPASAYPLMLNEEVFYGSAYGRATHQGLEFWDIDEGTEDLIPWSEVRDDELFPVYPRLISGSKPVKKTANKSTFNYLKTSAAEFPALEEWKSRFPQAHVEKRMKEFEDIFGTDYAGVVENIRANTRDAREKASDDGEFANLGSFYDRDSAAVIEHGSSRNGLRPSTISAATARISPQLVWWSNSSDNPHLGNQQEPLNYAMVMKKLATSGIDVPEDIQAVRKVRGEGKGQGNTRVDKVIHIPKGRHDLSTLTDEQIAFLPQIKNNARASDDNRTLALNIIRRDLAGEPLTLAEHLVASRPPGSQNEGIPPNVQAPKITSFDTTMLLKDESPVYTLDRHAWDIQGARHSRGSQIKSFNDAAKSFSEQRKQPPGLRDESGKKISVPDAYQLSSAAWDDARRLSDVLDGIRMPRTKYQSTGWIHHIARSAETPFKTKGRRPQGQEEWDSPLTAQRFARSNHTGLFMPYPDHRPTAACEEFHDYYGI